MPEEQMQQSWLDEVTDLFFALCALVPIPLLMDNQILLDEIGRTELLVLFGGKP
jgi:hypothetical protein